MYTYNYSSGNNPSYISKKLIIPLIKKVNFYDEIKIKNTCTIDKKQLFEPLHTQGHPSL